MKSPAPHRLLDLAVAALAGYRRGRSPRDAVAEVMPRDLAAPERAALARTVYAVVRGERRLAFALGDGILEDLDPSDRDAALVLAARVEAGEITAAAAGARWREGRAAALSFAGVEDVDAALQEVDAAERRFALRFSLPDWLAVLLRAEFGPSAEAVVAALDAEPPRTIRANTLRVAGRAALARDLAELGIATAAARWAPHALHVLGDADLFATEAYADGAFEQQDESSQLAASLVAPPPRGKVLDACAGSGGKTLALCAALQNRGVVLAADVHEGRLRGLRERARRAGAHALQIAAVGDGDWPDDVARFATAADRILLDVPCSGIGAWRRRPEARWTLLPTDLPALLAIQRELLDRAARALRPGARIVYATCSLLRSENEEQVRAALERHPDLQLVRAAEILGGELARDVADPTGTFLGLRPDVHGTDGFFAAVLRRPR